MKAVLRGLCVAVLCAAGSAWVASSAQAGEYTIAQCSLGNPAAPDMQLNATPPSAFDMRNHCPVGSPYATAWALRPLVPGDIAAVRWVTPPGLGFRSVRLEYAVGGSGAIQLNNTNNANPIVLSTSSLGRGTWVVPGGGTRSIVRAVVPCNVPNCAAAPGLNDFATVMDFSATIADTEAPAAAIGGSLISGGTVSGNKTVRIIGVDGGSGVHQTFIWVNGTIINHVNESCSVNRIVPCSTPIDRTVTVSTAALPFVEGLNAVTVCARDYATSTAPNQGCAPGQAVMVDN